MSEKATQDWQPIETLHVSMREVRLFFWVVPKTSEESYVDSAGQPIVSTHPPYLHRGQWETWGALSKATHWMPLPQPPQP